jgi:6-phosphogluconolactonase (cycloisomerase 2 family)
MSKRYEYNATTGGLDLISEVTVGTANGLSISADQALSLAAASTSTTGALTSTDWNTFNNKFTSPLTTAGDLLYQAAGTFTSSALTVVAPTITGLTSPTGIAFSPNGLFAYISNTGNSTISQFSRNNTTGALTPLTPSSVAVTNSTHRLVMSPDGTTLYSNGYGNGQISQFGVNTTTGLLTALTPDTISTSGTNPWGLCISPDGTSVYCTNFFGTTGIAQFSRDIGTGLLTALTPATVTPDQYPYTMQMAPSGLFVYVINGGTDTIQQFSRDIGTGLLTPLTPANISAVGASGITGSAISPDGKSLYVGGNASGTIDNFSIDTITGLLTYVSTIATAGDPQQIAIAPDGATVYTYNLGPDTMNQYSRNLTTGVLTALSPATVTPGTSSSGNTAGLSLSPDGVFAYVPGFNSNDVVKLSAGVAGPSVAARLPNGIAGQILQSTGSTTAPVWSNSLYTPNAAITPNDISITAGNTTDLSLTYNGGSVNINAGNANGGHTGGNINLNTYAGMNANNHGQVRLNGFDNAGLPTLSKIEANADLRISAQGTLTLHPSGQIIDAFNSNIQRVLDPVNPQDAATKFFIEGNTVVGIVADYTATIADSIIFAASTGVGVNVTITLPDPATYVATRKMIIIINQTLDNTFGVVRVTGALNPAWIANVGANINMAPGEGGTLITDGTYWNLTGFGG